MAWQIQEAKQRFSEVVQRARSEGPQLVTRHGQRAVIVVSAEDYDRLISRRQDFGAFLLEGPDLGSLDLERDRTLAPAVDL